jgi:hypothetical protein
LALALLGVIVLGAGLSLVAVLTESVKATVTRTYEQTWRAPYDILVHMPLPDGGILPEITEPNVLTTLPAGISVQQWQEIRALSGVQAAAPIAVVGYVRAGPSLSFPSKETVLNPEKGVYRITTQVSSAANPAEALTEDWIVAVADRATGARPDGAPAGTLVVDYREVSSVGVNAAIPTFLVGIDPTAENQLVGLDQALTGGTGLLSGEPITRIVRRSPEPGMPDLPLTEIPVLINEHGLRNLTYRLTVAELDAEQRVMRTVAEETWSGEQMAAAIRRGEKLDTRLLGRSGPLMYEPVPSPYPDRWPRALALRPASGDLRASFPPESPQYHAAIAVGEAFRTWQPAREVHYAYKVRGSFDSARLAVVKDPLLQMPLMTYRPAEAALVLDGAGRPVNPPQTVSGSLSPVGFLSSPPVLLTTIEGAVALGGENAINAIQVKVVGAEHFTPENVARVRQIAAAIEQKTGLAAEVTMGSSPITVLVQVPEEQRGWMEEAWIHKGAAVTAVQQAEFGYSAYAVLVILVAGLYASATGLTGVTARRRELGVAIALGWPERSLRWMVMAEQCFFAVAAGCLAAAAAGLANAPLQMVAGVFGLSLLIYLPAILISGQAAVRTAPGEALRWGDTAPGRRVVPGSGVLPLALSSLVGRPGRTALTVIATALPTALLVVLTFTTRYLHGILFTTLTGEYAALKVGPMQYAAGAVTLTIAAVTAFDLIRQNAADHRNERALLHALGWPRPWIAATMVAEGTILGLAAGIVGDLLGVGVLSALYGAAVSGAWQIALVVWLLPLGLGVGTGLLGSLAELRTWNRAGLASVRPRDVTRFSAATRLTGILLAVLVAGGTVSVAIARMAAEWKGERASTAKGADELAAAAIASAVARQNEALQASDAETYLSVVAPEASLFLLEERHWFEDFQVWRQEHPAATITRSIVKLSLLGSNTARVTLLQTATGAPLPSQVLETLWVQMADGRWLNHGYQHEVLQDGAVTIWYPVSLPEPTVRETLTEARKALDKLDAAGLSLPKPFVIEIKEDQFAFQGSLGPNLAGAGIQESWMEYGEPLRLHLRGGAPPATTIAYAAAARSAMERSNNHAPLWLREGVRFHGFAAMEGLDFQAMVNLFPPLEPAPPAALARLSTTLDRQSDDYAQLLFSGLLFVWYLNAEYGPGVLEQVYSELALAPVDPRMSGPATEPGRNEAAVRALERALHTTWPELNDRYETWLAQQSIRR